MFVGVTPYTTFRQSWESHRAQHKHLGFPCRPGELGASGKQWGMPHRAFLWAVHSHCPNPGTLEYMPTSGTSRPVEICTSCRFHSQEKKVNKNPGTGNKEIRPWVTAWLPLACCPFGPQIFRLWNGLSTPWGWGHLSCMQVGSQCLCGSGATSCCAVLNLLAQGSEGMLPGKAGSAGNCCREVLQLQAAAKLTASSARCSHRSPRDTEGSQEAGLPHRMRSKQPKREAN